MKRVISLLLLVLLVSCASVSGPIRWTDNMVRDGVYWRQVGVKENGDLTSRMWNGTWEEWLELEKGGE